MTLDVLQDRIGYRFKDESLLVLAVTHSSWANEHSAGNAHNERLEFLGDAVLEIAVSAQLFARFPDAREGELTRLRSSLVNEATLAVPASCPWRGESGRASARFPAFGRDGGCFRRRIRGRGD